MKLRFQVIALVAIAMSGFCSLAADQLAVKKGEKIVFMGDSITANGQRAGNGFVNLVMRTLNSEGLELTHVGAGKSGHRSPDMLARFDADVIQNKPQWLVLSCGVNDVWHFKLRLGNRTFQGVPLEDYTKNITAMIEKAQAAGIKVMLLTSTMIGEDPARELNQNLIPYNNFLKEVAKEKGCLLADLNSDMQETLKKMPDVPGKATMFGEPKYDRQIKNKLTVDGCHPNAQGHIMMAKGILKAFGLSDEKITAAEKTWAAP